MRAAGGVGFAGAAEDIDEAEGVLRCFGLGHQGGGAAAEGGGVAVGVVQQPGGFEGGLGGFGGFASGFRGWRPSGGKGASGPVRAR